MQQLHVIIADKHPVVRIGLAKLISSELGIDTCPVFNVDLNETNNYVRKSNKPVDLLIIGHAFRETSEIRKTLDLFLKKFGYNVPILVFSELDEQVYAPLCLAAGALGFISRGARFSMLAEAIDTVLKGSYFVNGRPVRSVEERMTLIQRSTNPMASLSEREREICEHLLQGYSCLDISDMLQVHRSTVSTYKNRVFKKLGVTNDTQFAELWRNFTNEKNTNRPKSDECNPDVVQGVSIMEEKSA